MPIEARRGHDISWGKNKWLWVSYVLSIGMRSTLFIEQLFQSKDSSFKSAFSLDKTQVICLLRCVWAYGSTAQKLFLHLTVQVCIWDRHILGNNLNDKCFIKNDASLKYFSHKKHQGGGCLNPPLLRKLLTTGADKRGKSVFFNGRTLGLSPNTTLAPCSGLVSLINWNPGFLVYLFICFLREKRNLK